MLTEGTLVRADSAPSDSFEVASDVVRVVPPTESSDFTLAVALRELRARCEVSQAELAGRLGTTQQRISSAENPPSFVAGYEPRPRGRSAETAHLVALHELTNLVTKGQRRVDLVLFLVAAVGLVVLIAKFVTRFG